MFHAYENEKIDGIAVFISDEIDLKIVIKENYLT